MIDIITHKVFVSDISVIDRSSAWCNICVHVVLREFKAKHLKMDFSWKKPMNTSHVVSSSELHKVVLLVRLVYQRWFSMVFSIEVQWQTQDI